MLRKITKDVGRFVTGSIHDFPKDTWEKIAQDYRKKRIKIKIKAKSEAARVEAILSDFSRPMTMDEEKADRIAEAARSERREQLRAERANA